MAYLVAINGTGKGRHYELEAEPHVLGRHLDCQIHIEDEDSSVSRRHARVYLDGEDYYIEDLESRNFTYVNGEKVDQQTGPCRLKHGDAIMLHQTGFVFRTGETPADSGMILFVDDVESSNSTIMSKVGVSSDSSVAQLTASPEVKLDALLKITRALGRALVLDDVLPQVLNSLFKIFVQADRGFIALRNEDGTLEPRWSRAWRNDVAETIRVSRTIVNQVMETQEAILSADAVKDARFNMSESIVIGEIRSMMCAPLIDGEGHSMGVLQIDALRKNCRFQPEDLEVLVAVANQASIAIDNAQLHERDVKQRVIERDLELAREVQLGFLPDHRPDVSAYEFFDFYRPASQVGGDYFDYLSFPDGRVVVIVADVAGKGVAAALMMAKLSAEARLCVASAPDPADAMTMLNERLCRQWDTLVTVILSVLDPIEHRVLIANAGHMRPIHRSASGQVIELGAESSGFPLGTVDDYQYQQTIVQLESGETVTMYTDGFSDAINTSGEFFRIERIRERIQATDGSAEVVGKAIVEDVHRFIGQRAQSDDMCLVSFGRV